MAEKSLQYNLMVAWFIGHSRDFAVCIFIIIII